MKLRLAPLALVALAACHAEPGPLTVDRPWARATAPGQSMAAVYFTVHNRGADDRLLSAAEIGKPGAMPAAIPASIHDSSMAGGVMRMRPATGGLAIPGGDTLLKPGGAHVMLDGLSGPLEPGDKLSLVLRFAHAGERRIAVPVLAAGSEGPAR